VSDKWWQSTVKNSGGVLPVALCKYWGELMGMAGGPVRLPLLELSLEEKQSLKADIDMVKDTTLDIKDGSL
jgi:dihydrodipicolinate synthase/N-acetylneuraminate lyase